MAGLLNINTGKIITSNDNMKSDFESFFRSLPAYTTVSVLIAAGSVRMVHGYKLNDNYGAFTYIQYGSGSNVLSGDFVNITGGIFNWAV